MSHTIHDLDYHRACAATGACLQYDRFGADFVDLRNALEPTDFIDMVHPNQAGKRKLARILVGLIARQSRLANASEATTGAPGP